MKLTTNEIKWLELYFPKLRYESSSFTIIGELGFCAAYNSVSGELIIGDNARKIEHFICDVFEIKICLTNLDKNGWPKVHEIGGRHRQIAEQCQIPIIDLHFYPTDGRCCLGLNYGGNRNFRIKELLPELVIPFLYQLSYTAKFGIAATRKDLWGEYSHGDKGLEEYEAEMLNIEKHHPKRNDLCPCRSGKKYKRCHMDQVKAVKRKIRGRTPDITILQRP